MTMRARIAAITVAAVLLCATAAFADNCYSNSQCSAGYICWGGECVPGGSNGQTPSTSGSGEVNWVFLGLGIVLIGAVICWLRPGGPASSAAQARVVAATPPAARSKDRAA